MALRVFGKGQQDPEDTPPPKKAFRRRFVGYHREDVDEMLLHLTASLTSLEIRLQAAEFAAKQEDLVLRATRRSVDEVLKRAEKDADGIRSAAESDAASLLAEVFGPLRGGTGAAATRS